MPALTLYLDADATDALSADFEAADAYAAAIARYEAAAEAGCAKWGIDWNGVEFLRNGGATRRFRLDDGDEYDFEDAISSIRHDAWNAAMCGA